MSKYIVEDTIAETRTTHTTWAAAFRVASKIDPAHVRILERDRDGEREYDLEGNIVGRDS